MVLFWKNKKENFSKIVKFPEKTMIFKNLLQKFLKFQKFSKKYNSIEWNFYFAGNVEKNGFIFQKKKRKVLQDCEKKIKIFLGWKNAKKTKTAFLQNFFYKI